MEAKDLKVRILNIAGEIVETREVHYDSIRLTRAKKMELLSLCNRERFMDIDANILMKVNENNGNVPDGAVKGFDLGAMAAAREKSIDECTKILFGLGDVKLENIPDEDFKPLAEIASEKDPLGFISAEKKLKK